MRIVFLGTSHGIPQPGRKCSCTLVETAGRIYLVDMGTMVMEALVSRGIPAESIRAVLLTHMHGDHVNGLPAFVDQISWAWKDADPEIFLPDASHARWLEGWVALTSGRERTFRWRGVEEGLILDDGALRVTAFQNRHTERSFSFLLEAEGKRVLFTGDLKNPEKDFPALENGTVLDLMVGEAAHFPPADYIGVCRQYAVKQLCLNHCSPKKLPELADLKEALTPMPVTAVFDGMEMTL